MSFSTAVPGANAAFITAFGVSATYTPVSGSAFTCVFLPGRQSEKEFYGQDLADIKEIVVLHSSFTGAGLTSPTARSGNTPGDSISFVGLSGTTETWTVVDADSNPEASWWILKLAKNERARQ